MTDNPTNPDLPWPSDAEIKAAFAQGEQAVLDLFHRLAGPEPPGEPAAPGRAVQQGDIYWAAPAAPGGAEPGIPHPHVVIQEDVINRSRAASVVVCALTSNLGRVSIPGNVLLAAGEANLPRQSVVEVAKVTALDKRRLGGYIGRLSPARVQQILAGMQFQQTFTEPDGRG